MIFVYKVLKREFAGVQRKKKQKVKKPNENYANEKNYQGDREEDDGGS